MKVLLGLIGQMAALNAASAVKRAKRTGIVAAISGVLFFTAYIFGLIALAIWLARRHSPEVAVLMVAVGALVLGIAALVYLAIYNRIEQRKARERRMAIQSSVAVGMTMLKAQPLLMAGVGISLLNSFLSKPRRKG